MLGLTSSPDESLLDVTLNIQVRASSDAHILLSFEGERQAWEIVVGGWGNTQSQIRRGSQGIELATLIHPKGRAPLAEGKWRDVVIRWREEGGGRVLIIVQAGGERLKVVANGGARIPRIKDVYLGSGFGSASDWKVFVSYGETHVPEKKSIHRTSLASSESHFDILEGIPSSVAALEKKENDSCNTPIKNSPARSFGKATPLSSILKRRSKSVSSPNQLEQPETSPRRQHKQIADSIAAIISQFD